MKITLKNAMELPVYRTKHYEFVRTKDIEGYIKLELERWIFGKLCPLIHIDGEGTVKDAVFLEDYKVFVNEYLAGKQAKVN